MRPPRLPSFFAAAAAAAAADSECLPWIGASPPAAAERCFFSASCLGRGSHNDPLNWETQPFSCKPYSKSQHDSDALRGQHPHRDLKNHPLWMPQAQCLLIHHASNSKNNKHQTMVALSGPLLEAHIGSRCDREGGEPSECGGCGMPVSCPPWSACDPHAIIQSRQLAVPWLQRRPPRHTSCPLCWPPVRAICPRSHVSSLS